MSSVHDSENQLFSSEDEQYEEDHHARILDRPSKRIRTDSSKQKPPRKKYVKGRQGGLQGIMKMPMEVFMEDGKQLVVYLNSANVSRLGELNDLKSERREQIHERLSALGWEDQYLRFDRGNAERQWNLLVGVSKPLTDRTSSNMLPKLTQLLEENRAEIDKIHQRQHRCARILKAEDLLRQLRRDTHPYQSIINALQMEGPLIQTGFNSLEYRLILPTPFPDNRVIRGWDLIKGNTGVRGFSKPRIFFANLDVIPIRINPLSTLSKWKVL
ncbi:hypothetical protein RSAG8_05690, partial [Rhizoctonia solani AG-8 WAC10335]